MPERERNSALEGVFYSFEAGWDYLKQQNKGLLIGAVIVLIVTVITLVNAYKNLSDFLGYR